MYKTFGMYVNCVDVTNHIKAYFVPTQAYFTTWNIPFSICETIYGGKKTLFIMPLNFENIKEQIHVSLGSA